MAIIVNNRKSGLSLSRLIFIVIVLGILIFSVYYLFFAPTPGVEVILPGSFEQTKKIATFSLDPGTVFDSPAFKSLKRVSGAQNSGTFGRDNPFIAP